jgi:hypothetical protein
MAKFSIVENPSRNVTENKSTSKPFIQANTQEVSLDEIKDNHLIPVFIKDNEPLINHMLISSKRL